MWILLIAFSHLSQSWVQGDGTYECGDHGRFEYCIDEIPGCVIGCHCHPGYYFDTDTKICEPNSRLIEHHRRNNVVKPDQIQKNYMIPNVYDPESASSTYKIDGQINEIAKDANDLGDWLYDQFFKTIENQVINNTNDKEVITRRKGLLQPNTKAKNNKKWRKVKSVSKSTNKKGKKKQLRRKLLRITENDSLFDMSSKSSSDSSDSSSTNELSSMEYEINESTHRKHDDDEHGHKKIVMINKKPKQPLPSFIFLPNLDTPFYPPIGLPPPPIVPMYPIVPVPPVPVWQITDCDDTSHKATTSSSPMTATTAAAVSSDKTYVTTVSTNIPSNEPETTAAISSDDADTTTDEPQTDIKVLRFKNNNKKNKKKKTSKQKDDGTGTEPRINNWQYVERQKLLQRLKEKVDNPAAKLFLPSWNKNKKIFANKFTNRNKNADFPFLDTGMVKDEYANNLVYAQPMQEDENFGNNVDFKYITELIHRDDINNKSNHLRPIEYNPLDSIELNQSPLVNKNKFSDYIVPFDSPESRRINRLNHNTDEYYANLGRQIATMIRGMDMPQNIELNESPNKITSDSYFKKNSPTSFWERSPRSPLTFYKTKNKKFEYLKRSNELLFDIENKVEIIASTAPTLTLQEIENIVKIMEVTKKKFRETIRPNTRNLKTSAKNLNIDLLPKAHNVKYNNKISVLPYVNEGAQARNINSNKINNNNNLKAKNNLPFVRMHSIQNVVTWNGNNEKIGQNIKVHSKPINKSHNFGTNKPPIKKNDPLNYHLENANRIFQAPARYYPYSQNNMKQTYLNQQLNKYFLGPRKYYHDNNNYVNQGVRRFPPILRTAGKQPSYFSDVNHFDYMQ